MERRRSGAKLSHIPPPLLFPRLFPFSSTLLIALIFRTQGARGGEDESASLSRWHRPPRGRSPAVPRMRSGPSRGGGRQGHGRFAQRAPSPPGWQKRFEERTCLSWQRFVPRPDLPLTPPLRESPQRAPLPTHSRGSGTLAKERPLAPLFPFSAGPVCVR